MLVNATNLHVLVDMAAMGDFENSRVIRRSRWRGCLHRIHQDRFNWFYSIDGAAPQNHSLLRLLLNRLRRRTHLRGASVGNIPDPAFITTTEGTFDSGWTTISIPFQVPFSGHGGECVDHRIGRAVGWTDFEVYAFDNIVIRGALAVEPSELIGDYNDNEIVGLNDLNLVLFNWNRNANLIPVSWLNQRPVDKSVELGELNAVLFNWGNASTRPIGDLSPNTIVPEPGGLILGLQALMVGWLVRRSRRR